MRFEMQREYYIPKGAQKVTCKRTGAVAYLYNGAANTNASGMPCAMVFRPKAKKPDWRFRFPNDEKRAARIKEFFDNVAERKASRKNSAKERNAGHDDVKIGTILYASWGYDQTNVDWYQVVGKSGKTMLEVRKIANIGARGGEGPSYGNCTPAIDNFTGSVMRKRWDAKYKCVTIDQVQTAYLWDGRPKSAGGWH